jgi:hypothetical protein
LTFIVPILNEGSAQQSRLWWMQERLGLIYQDDALAPDRSCQQDTCEAAHAITLGMQCWELFQPLDVTDADSIFVGDWCWALTNMQRNLAPCVAMYNKINTKGLSELRT